MSPDSPADAPSGVPSDGDLLALAHVADGCAPPTGGAVVAVRSPLPHRDHLGVWPLGGLHPLEALAGFTAPAGWRAIGVTVAGRAVGTAGPSDDEVTVTVLIGRGGGGAGVLRRGHELTRLPGRPEGVVADACRRALGLPTAPPPRSTRALWTMCWLDRVVEAASTGDARDLGWNAVARLHPACAGAMSPTALAAAALALAEAWPWAQVRGAPEVLDLPDKAPADDVGAWMDDGMWARWVLGSFPALGDLVSACRALLPATVADAVELVVAGSGAEAT
jgi:hypothetical protein